MRSPLCVDYIGFVGTTSTNGSRGVYKIGIDATSMQIRILDVRPAYNSGYLALSRDKKRLYVLSEGMIFRGKASGGITAYNVENGAFEEINHAYTHGQRPCYVSYDEEAGEIYVGNFVNGTLCIFQRGAEGEIGPRKACLTHPKMGPFGPSVHCAVKCPGGRYLAGVEISGDMIYLYDCENDYQIVDSATTAHMSGPRHMVFSPNGKYLFVNKQMDEQVSVFRFCPLQRPMLTEIQSISVRTEQMAGRTEPSAIRLCPGRNLLAVSNRGRDQHHADSVTLFEFAPESGLLSRKQVIMTGGQLPRDINFTPDGKYLVVGYQAQGYLDLYRFNEDTQRLVYAGRGPNIPSPVCIAF